MQKEYVYAGITILMWGSGLAVNGVLIKDMHPMVMLFLGSLVASVFLTIMNLCKGRLHFRRKPDMKLAIVIIVLGLMNFLYNYMLNSSLLFIKTQQSTVINYLWPVFLVVFSCIFLGERMTGWKGLALLLSFIGVAIVVTEGNPGNLGEISLPGVLLALAAAVTYALFCVLNKSIDMDNFLAMMFYYMVSTVTSGVSLAVSRIPVPVAEMNALNWVGIIWVGMLVYGLAYALWAKAIQTGNTPVISNLAYITPMVSMVWIRILVGEKIEFSALIGLGFVLMGIVVQIFGERKKL